MQSAGGMWDRLPLGESLSGGLTCTDYKVPWGNMRMNEKYSGLISIDSASAPHCEIVGLQLLHRSRELCTYSDDWLTIGNFPPHLQFLALFHCLQYNIGQRDCKKITNEFLINSFIVLHSLPDWIFFVGPHPHSSSPSWSPAPCTWWWRCSGWYPAGWSVIIKGHLTAPALFTDKPASCPLDLSLLG